MARAVGFVARKGLKPCTTCCCISIPRRSATSTATRCARVFARRRAGGGRGRGDRALARDDRRGDRATRRSCTWTCSGRTSATPARMLRRAPGFAVTAIVIVALGIGATTAAFSVTDFVLLRPLPFSEAESPGAALRDDAGLLAARAVGGELSRLESGQPRCSRASACITPRPPTSSAPANRCGSIGTAVSYDLFPTLRVQPLIGRLFTEADDRDGAPGTMILSYRLWQTQFGGDPSIVGRQLRSTPSRSPCIGVMPQAFRFPTSEVQYWTPLRFNAEMYVDRNDNWHYARRAAARRRDHRSGAGGDGRPRGAVEAAVSGGQQGRRRAAVPARDRRRVAAGAAAAVRAVGRRGLRAADRLRQPRQPAAGARARAPPRARRPHRDGRRPRADDPSADDREPAARRRRRRARCGDCLRRGAAAEPAGADQSAAGQRADRRSPRAAVRHRAHRSSPVSPSAWRRCCGSAAKPILAACAKARAPAAARRKACARRWWSSKSSPRSSCWCRPAC